MNVYHRPSTLHGLLFSQTALARSALCIACSSSRTAAPTRVVPLVQLHLLALRVFRPPTSPRYLALATLARIACGLLLLLHAPTTPPRAYGRTYVFERSAIREIRVYMRVSVSRRSEPPQRTPSLGRRCERHVSTLSIIVLAY